MYLTGGEDEDAIPRAPNRWALRLTGCYALLATAYVAISWRWVASQAPELARAELGKSLGFAGAAGALFVVAWLVLARVQTHATAQVLERNHRALEVARQQAHAGLVASAVAHDLSNMLTILHGGIHELKYAAPDDSDGVLRDVEAAFTGSVKLTKELARASSTSRFELVSAVNVGAKVKEAISLLRYHERAKDAHLLRCDLKAEPSIMGNGLLIEQLTTNLVLNALEAAGSGANVRAVVTEQDDAAIVEVHDNGPGVPPTKRTKIFDPEVTSKPTGVGLGLLSARLAAEAHGGSIEVEDSPDGGACFRARLYSIFSPDGRHARR